MRAYLDLVRLPGVVRITASQLLARFPLGMLSLAVLLHVRALTGSYAVAGAAVALLSVGEAVSMPTTARLAGRFGVRPTVAALTAVEAAAMLLLASGGPSGLRVPVLLALGLVIGLAVPPLLPIVRALYPRLAPEDRVATLFALDTSAQELIWILGPVAATVLATTVSTALPLVIAAAVSVVGTGWFLLSRNVAEVRLHRNRAPFGRVLGHRTMRLAVATSFAMVASFGAIQIALVSRFSEHGPLAGVAIAAGSLGSLIGGFALGHRRFGKLGLAGMLAGMAAATAAAAFAAAPLLLFFMMFVSGLGFAPSLATLYAMVSAGLPPVEAPEAFGWLGTAGTVGGAVGTAIAGAAGQAGGEGGAFAVATAAAVIAAGLPLVPGIRPLAA